jgi:hypothetical protein
VKLVNKEASKLNVKMSNVKLTNKREKKKEKPEERQLRLLYFAKL